MPIEATRELRERPGSQPPTAGPSLLLVTGMNCANCARHVTEAIQGVPGVRSATVNLEAQQATVRWTPGTPLDLPAVIQAVEAAGYGAKAAETQTVGQAAHKASGWRLSLWMGVLGTLPLMLGEWVFGMGMARWFQWLSFALAGAVQVLAGARFYRGAWSQLKQGSSNMDTLVALGSTTAFGYSAWALLSGVGGHVYFMEAAAIITLISAGHWLESHVSARASSALRQLLDLAPAMAVRREPEGAERQVPAAELRPGDLVVLRPGDRVPTDGEVAEGDSTVDESTLTGESVPAEKSAGGSLYAGTVNLNGRLLMRVTATGEETALAHVIAAVQRAQSSRANIQRLGDRVSSVFVPLVVAVALAAGLWWGLAPESARAAHSWLAQFLWPVHLAEGPLAAAFIIAAGVLIIACPCAMGLATPAAIMAGSNVAAQRGILIRDGVALEKAGRVTAVLFDKTGTLTIGKPQVVEVWEGREPRNPKPETRNSREARDAKSGAQNAGASPLFGLAVALARHSRHPVSQAVARLAAPEARQEAGGGVRDQPPLTIPDEAQLSDWEEIRGEGVVARIQRQETESGSLAREQPVNQAPPDASPASDSIPRAFDLAPPFGLRPSDFTLVRLGSLRWLGESGVDLAPGKGFVEDWSAQGATIVGLAADKSLLGLFAVKDTLKPGAREVVQRLLRQELKSFLVTGDNARTAAGIASQAGIAAGNVFAEVRPEQKAELVRRLQQRGERVAFIGDGINDAPALEQADLGIAVSRASDIAREAADIILLKSEIEAVPESLGLARATLRTIKQNLFWAFFYNAISVPLAALGFISPVLCAVAMGLSDLVVLGNCLRLRQWKLDA